MKKLFALAAVAMLAACENGFVIPDFRGNADPAGVASGGPLAPTPQPSDRARFISAIEANGCVIDVTTVAAIMAQASINVDQLKSLSEDLDREGVLKKLEGEDAARLISPACPQQ